jgi:hypothetical protein
MPTWKKVIVSGSTANLAALQVDNLTLGQVVIGGGSANLSTTAINGSGNIVATTGASGLVHSGSFSGSFQGDGSLLNGVSANFPTTPKTDLTTTDKFFINDTSSKHVTYGSLLTDLAGTNLVTESNDSLTLASQISVTGVTASFLGNLTGTATTASYVVTAQTASYVLNAISSSYALNATSATSATSASYALSSSFASTSPAGNLTGATLASNVLASSLTSVGTLSSLTATNATITNNLIVQGTASFQNTTNLEVADRFVLFASGSTGTGDGGIVVQQGIQNVGELYGYENSINRWGFTSSFNAGSSTFTPAAFITTTEVSTAVPSAAPLYGGASGHGNIHVKTDTGDIYIYA